ncbi:putative membrane protein, partial [Emiliania huxleyi virus 99B1]
ASALGLLI